MILQAPGVFSWQRQGCPRWRHLTAAQAGERADQGSAQHSAYLQGSVAGRGQGLELRRVGIPLRTACSKVGSPDSRASPSLTFL